MFLPRWILALAFGASAVAGSPLLAAPIAREPHIPRDFRFDTLRSKKGFNWRVDHSSRVDYYYEPLSPADRDIDQIKSTMEADYGHVLTLLGTNQRDFRLQTFIVESRPRMVQLCHKELNGWAIGNVFAFVYGDKVKALGAHEVCHLLAQRTWGQAHELWINEGLAVYSDDNWHGHPLHAICKQLREHGRLISLSSMMGARWPREYPDDITYPEAGSFVKFLYERYGMTSVRSIWQQGSPAIPKVFGKSLNQLEQEWYSTIDSSDASSFIYPMPSGSTR